jgi:hypothetical protein
LQQSAGKIHDRERFRPGPVQGPGVDYSCLAVASLPSDVRVTVEQVVKMAAVFQVIQQVGIVAMDKGHIGIWHFERPERFVQGPAQFRDGLAEAFSVGIAVTKNEVGVPWEQGYDFRILDVAAMEDQLYAKAFEQVDGFLDHLRPIMRVAQDGNSHSHSGEKMTR